MTRPVRALISLVAISFSTIAAAVEVRLSASARNARFGETAPKRGEGGKPATTYEETRQVRLKPDTTYEQTHDILLSRQLAEQAHVGVGDVVTVAADAQGHRATRFRVAGVYEPIADPRRFSIKRLEAHLHLPDLLALSQDPSDPLSLESVGALNVAERGVTEVLAARAASSYLVLLQCGPGVQ